MVELLHIIALTAYLEKDKIIPTKLSSQQDNVFRKVIIKVYSTQATEGLRSHTLVSMTFAPRGLHVLPSSIAGRM